MHFKFTASHFTSNTGTASIHTNFQYIKSYKCFTDLGLLTGFYGSDHCPVSLELSPASPDSNES
jgi:hypothetical protein